MGRSRTTYPSSHACQWSCCSGPMTTKREAWESLWMVYRFVWVHLCFTLWGRPRALQCGLNEMEQMGSRRQTVIVGNIAYIKSEIPGQSVQLCVKHSERERNRHLFIQESDSGSGPPISYQGALSFSPQHKEKGPSLRVWTGSYKENV